MNWAELFRMQKKLDEYIVDHNELDGEDLFNQKFLALLVELGELANETRCFKFWSTKSKAEKKVILEEYVDGIHFLLSLGIEKDLNFSDVQIEQTCLNETDQFNKVFESCIFFKKNPTEANYQMMFKHYLQLGQLLGFKEMDIQNAYYDKNQVNYERQLQGY